MTTDVASLDDEALAAEAARLAALRTEIRLRQNEVQAEIDLRAALASMSGSSQNIIKIRLGGAIEPSGEVTGGAE